MDSMVLASLSLKNHKPIAITASMIPRATRPLAVHEHFMDTIFPVAVSKEKP